MQMRRLAAAALVCALALPVNAIAQGSSTTIVRLVDLTKTVRRGGYGSITVRAVGRSFCNLRIFDAARPQIALRNLPAKGTLFAGIVRWQWMIPPAAPRGTWVVMVACGSTGTLRTSFTVH
jgi:hypothetical protein